MTLLAQAITALSPLAQSGPWRGVAVVAIVLLVLLLLGWGAREWFLLRQATRLERAARKIAEGDDAARSGLRAGSGTVGRLVAAFDAMADAVQGRLDRSRERVRAIRRATEKVRRRAARQREKLKAAESSGQEQRDELETLRESQARYRAVIGQTAEGFFLANADNKQVLEFNKAFRQMLGYTSGEMRTLTVYDFSTDGRDAVDAGFQD